MKIYTRKGDDGTTSLWYGGRVAQERRPHRGLRRRSTRPPPRSGVARVAVRPTSACAADILHLQDDLFVAGAELATAPEARGRLEAGVSRARRRTWSTWLEQAIDGYMAEVDLPPEVRDPRRHAAVGAARRRAAVLRRAERRIVALAHREQTLGDSAVLKLREPRVGPALRDGALRGRARARAVRGPRPFVGGGRREGQRPRAARATRTAVTSEHHTLIVDEPAEKGGTDTGPRPTRAAGAEPRLLHRDHDRDVRGPQGLGRRRRWRSTSTTSSTREGTSRFDVVAEAPGRAHRRAGWSSCSVDRRQVPGAPRAARRESRSPTGWSVSEAVETRLLIGGEQVAGRRRRRWTVENPYTEETLATVALPSAEQVDAAIAAAREAARGWAAHARRSSAARCCTRSPRRCARAPTSWRA